MTMEAFDLPELQHLAHLPEITLDVYKALPEDVSEQIEVVDGWMVRCESAEPAHQTIQRNFANHLWAAVKAHDASKRACHRVGRRHDQPVPVEAHLGAAGRRPLGTWRCRG
jgi:hypothetical protein